MEAKKQKAESHDTKAMLITWLGYPSSHSPSVLNGCGHI